MSKPYVDSPFSDAVGKDSVGPSGSGPGTYDSSEVPNTPGRDGGMFPELHRDDHFSDPKLSGPYKTPFKNAVD